MKKKILIVLAVVLVLVAGASFLYLCNGDHSTVYYTMVDNNRVKEQTAASSGAGSYEYHLDTYDADGNMKSLSFKTSRELREGAYLKLEVMPVRGVISWEEVKYENLPEAIKSVYPN